MGGTPSYRAPEPDPTVQAINAHTLERTKRDEQIRDAQDLVDKQRAEAVVTTGKEGFNSFLSNLKNRYESGLETTQGAKAAYDKYVADYNLGKDFSGASEFNNFYATTTNKEAGDRTYLAGQTYRDLLGREAKADELEKFSTSATHGFTLGMLADSLKNSDEYKQSASYFASPAEAEASFKYGTQVRDAAGKKTGKYSFTFAPSTSPTLNSGSLRAGGISFGESPTTITGTPEEIEAARKKEDMKTTFLYNAGLANLQGQIDKETTKLKNAGAKEVAQVQGQGQLLSNLTSGFWG